MPYLNRAKRTLLLALTIVVLPLNAYSPEEIMEFREEAKEMFYHGFDNYMEFGFPDDELMPLSCEGRRRETQNRGHLDDILGDFSLTLVDSIDTLMIFGDVDNFRVGVNNVISNVRFNRNVTVSVFEVTIRVLGGLLSSHLLAEEHLSDYRGELLDMATDLGERLLPAFKTKTKIPVSRVNLVTGIPRGDTLDTCTACAGTLLLEFGLLSRLTGKTIYEDKARDAVISLFNRRSSIGLFGNVINTHTGRWSHSESGIGAGIDSFYEYLLKAYIFLGDPLYYDMINQTYTNVGQWINKDHWYPQVDMNSGQLRYNWVDSLSAFWPGLQVLFGDVKAAEESHARYYQLWKRYGALPERYDPKQKQAVIKNYPLRPEFVETTYLLHRATKDPHYLRVGREIMESLQTKCRVNCGFASVANVETKRLEDRMDSFFLSETCKYLYLLFDDTNAMHSSNFIFTTEGHLFPVKYDWQTRDKTARNVAVNASCLAQKREWSLKQLFGDNSNKNGDCSPETCSTPDQKPKEKKKYVINGIDKMHIKDIQIELVEKASEAIVEIDMADGVEQRFYALWGQFGVKETVQSEVVIPENREGCKKFPKQVDFTGKIVALYRGGCMFIEKVSNAQRSGAMGVVIINTMEDKKVFAMSGTISGKLDKSIKIPAVMINLQDGNALAKAIQDDPSSLITITKKTPLVRKTDSMYNLQVYVKMHHIRHAMEPEAGADVFVSGHTILFNNADPYPDDVDWQNVIVSLVFDASKPLAIKSPKESPRVSFK